MSKMIKWTVTEYGILQFTPASGYVAMYRGSTVPGGDGSDFSTPVDGLAVCRVTSIVYARDELDPDMSGREYAREVHPNQICGVCFGEGEFHVVDEDSNFIRLAKAGDEPK